MKKLLIAAFAVAAVSLVFVIRMALTNLSAPDSEVLAVAIQSSGKSVIAGRFLDSRIQRRNADGTVDDSFSSQWTAGGFNGAVVSLAIQGDDKILAVGEFTNFDTSLAGHVARLKANGSLDTSFARAIGTGFDDTVTAISIQPDGKMLLGGVFTSFNGVPVRRIARLNPDGTLDASLASEQGFDAGVFALLSLSGGQIVAGGQFRTYNGATKPYLANLDGGGTLNAQYPKTQ